MTQPVYDFDTLRRFLDKTASLNLTIIMGVLPLMSLRHALFLGNEVPGVVIPNKIMRRIESAGDRAQEAGIDLAVQISQRCRDYVAGIYYMPSFGRYETIGSILKQI
jgi:5,10-methylenetetrahydrofolate reductase